MDRKPFPVRFPLHSEVSLLAQRRRELNTDGSSSCCSINSIIIWPVKASPRLNLHRGGDAAMDPLRRHERADQKPRPDVKKLRVLAHGFLNVGDRRGDLDDAVVARAETELVHGLDPPLLLNCRAAGRALSRREARRSGSSRRTPSRSSPESSTP